MQLFFRCCFVFTVLSVTALALMPLEGTIVIKVWDKLNHLVAFSVLAALLYLSNWLRGWRYFTLLLGYGVLIEVMQSFTPHRFFSIADIAADLVGIALGFIAIKWLVGRCQKGN
ncbi:VanZ family protein [Thalassotalea aquiviva]|uniref:VanZ family protein n=1 Tax=Thalassotalea aquiviva TaxID=3242415 RepID=UPI00352B7C8E